MSGVATTCYVTICLSHDVSDAPKENKDSVLKSGKCWRRGFTRRHAHNNSSGENQHGERHGNLHTRKPQNRPAAKKQNSVPPARLRVPLSARDVKH